MQHGYRPHVLIVTTYMSVGARKRIAGAQKARWAKVRAKQ